MGETILTWLLLVGSGLLMGGIVVVAVAVVPAEGTLPPHDYARWHTSFARHMDRFIPAVAVATLLIGTSLVFLHGQGPGRGLLAAGGLLIVLIAVISEMGNRPLNRQLAAAGPDTSPAEIERVRARWRRLHLYRTAAALLSHAAFAAAVSLAG